MAGSPDAGKFTPDDAHAHLTPVDLSSPLVRGPQIARGKTKAIHETNNPNLVYIVSGDGITAGDGAKRDVLEGKAALATETTANVFRLLNANGIPTHFIDTDPNDPTAFVAKKARMIPLEVVTRSIAYGSYTKRNPKVAEGTPLNLPVEFYFKEDVNHDPIIHYNQGRDTFTLYPPKEDIDSERTPIREITWADMGIQEHHLQEMEDMARRVFRVLQEAWGNVDITLVDIKIEFGFDSDGNLIVADVIDNDSWRLWPNGDPTQMLDKQNYRNIPGVATQEQLAVINDKYAIVAALTRTFVPHD